jgi:hypothetical protein
MYNNRMIATIDTSDPNISFFVEHISILPNIQADVTYTLYDKSAGTSTKHTMVIDNDTYRRWSSDDRYVFICICNKHNLNFVEHIEPEFIEWNYCLPNPDGTFRNIKEMIKNSKYTGLPPLVITHETIIKNDTNANGSI